MRINWKVWLGILIGLLIYGGIQDYISSYFPNPLLMVLVGLILAVVFGIGFKR